MVTGYMELGLVIHTVMWIYNLLWSIDYKLDYNQRQNDPLWQTNCDRVSNSQKSKTLAKQEHHNYCDAVVHVCVVCCVYDAERKSDERWNCQIRIFSIRYNEYMSVWKSMCDCIRDGSRNGTWKKKAQTGKLEKKRDTPFSIPSKRAKQRKKKEKKMRHYCSD